MTGDSPTRRRPRPRRTAVIVVAKAPVPGTVKTRLSPPLTLAQAAQLAAAALSDTMDAVEECADLMSVEPVLALTGDLRCACGSADIGRRLTPGSDGTWELLRQRGHSFGERLFHAHLDAGDGRATLQIGMDTPQVSRALLADAVRTLWRPGTDAVLGPCNDGGWWALGLRPGLSAAFLTDVPMSTERTGAFTLRAMHRCGLRVAALPTLTDVDTAADAVLVAARFPQTRFADALSSMSLPHPAVH